MLVVRADSLSTFEMFPRSDPEISFQSSQTHFCFMIYCRCPRPRALHILYHKTLQHFVLSLLALSVINVVLLLERLWVGGAES
jgi:hypothetical protein